MLFFLLPAVVAAVVGRGADLRRDRIGAGDRDVVDLEDLILVGRATLIDVVQEDHDLAPLGGTKVREATREVFGTLTNALF